MRRRKKKLNFVMKKFNFYVFIEFTRLSRVVNLSRKLTIYSNSCQTRLEARVNNTTKQELTL